MTAGEYRWYNTIVSIKNVSPNIYHWLAIQHYSIIESYQF